MMTRIQKAQKILQEHVLDALIIDAPVDLYYLTGMEVSLGRLVISHDEISFYVDGRYFEQCRKNANIEVCLSRGYGRGSVFEEHFSFRKGKVGFDAASTSFQVYQQLSELGCELIALDAPIKQIRQIKDHSEIEKLKKASTLASKGYDYLLSLLEEGITEEELAISLEIFWRKSGAKKVSFDPHIAFGANTSQPHYKVGNNQLKPGDTVLIDIGVELDHYHSDMTRVVFFKEVSSQMEEIYRIVQKAQSEALHLCKPGTFVGELDAVARSVIAENGYGDFFIHSLGHGIGLEVHELPFIRNQAATKDQPLIPGMALTIEPGIYLPEIGGVRLEDSIVITENGYENLTKRPLAIEMPVIGL